MDVERFLGAIEGNPDYAGQIEHLEILAERAGRWEAPERPLPDPIVGMLRRGGIDGLYAHQAAALDGARDGRDLVIVTGTASGKTLCYHLPILETCWTDPDARALFLFPTKALAQDQLRGLLERIDGEPDVAERIRPGVYDGDTPTSQRRRIKAEANLVLTNPDMLHASILPYHPKWARFFSGLRYVVVDEIHMYRGILGAHVACVLRRLLRICAHYGARPQFVCASATIANPGELASKLVDRPVDVIDDDGSPRGRKFFAFWNPTPHGQDRLARRGATEDAVWLMAELMRHGAQALAFTRTRQAAELIDRYVREAFAKQASPLAEKVRAYRGGYLPDERRKIEQDLFRGDLCGVASTNALELGVDIGSLDAALLVHYPGTIASAWQQAGRSGRRCDDSLAVLIAGNDPVDQYLLRHPRYFFEQSPEQAVVDPENPYVLANHLRAAAHELPIEAASIAEPFGAAAEPIAGILVESRQLAQAAGRYYATSGQNPAQRISLRHMSDETYSIILRRPGVPAGDAKPHEVIANVDAISAPELIYPEAVYLHNGQSFVVRELDLTSKVAYVERRETDYYTQAILESNVRITRERTRKPIAAPASLAFGEVDVTWKTVAFKKVKFNTRENIGYGTVDIPEQTLPTTAFWLAPDDDVRARLKAAGYRPSEGLCGLRNLAVVGLPMIAMCDSRDISGVVDSRNLGHSAMIVYDRYPGGLGYCERGYRRIEELLGICRQLVTECDCEEGCPSCVGLPNLRPAIHSDPDLMRGYPIPDKRATIELLEQLVAEPVTACASRGAV
ncbi:MAG: DEAD/DEAH box helicase [Planctomycetes bacterium]|nr:DEAD/DEAH box helicase [Planctomycetota bacterium]